MVPLTSPCKRPNFVCVKMSLAIKLFYYMHKKEIPIFRYQQTTRVAGSGNYKKYCIFKMEKEFAVYDCKLLIINLKDNKKISCNKTYNILTVSVCFRCVWVFAFMLPWCNSKFHFWGNKNPKWTLIPTLVLTHVLGKQDFWHVAGCHAINVWFWDKHSQQMQLLVRW